MPRLEHVHRKKMAEGDTNEPRTKRRKVAHEIFYSFLHDEDAVSNLEYSCGALEQGNSGMRLMFYKIVDTDAKAKNSFSEASVCTEEYIDNIPFPIGDVFVDGLDVVKKYLLTDGSKIPKDMTQQRALAKLLMFFSKEHSWKDHESLFEESNSGSEGRWAITIAQHLLSKLSACSSYVIAPYPGYKSDRKFVCPCKQKDELVGKVGDTSYGCKEGWHGSTDIIIEDSPVPVSVLPLHLDQLESSNEEPSDSDVSFDLVEVKSSKKFSEKDLKQIKAETIVFSFLQLNSNRENLSNNFLIPGIGINSERVIINFYDAENDILLGSPALELLSKRGEEKELVYQSVFLVWLTLNYRCFCSGITEKMKKNKAGFFDNVGDSISLYREKLIRPCNIEHTTPETPWWVLSKTKSFDDKREPTVKYISYD